MQYGHGIEFNKDFLGRNPNRKPFLIVSRCYKCTDSKQRTHIRGKKTLFLSFVKQFLIKKKLDVYTRLLGLPNVWIRNDWSKIYLCQDLCLYHKMNDSA